MADVTIDLDIDEESWSDLDVLSDRSLEDDEDDVIIDYPILVSQVIVKLPGTVRIKHLAKELRDIIAINLQVPSTLSIGSWQKVADFLCTSELYQGENNEKNHKDIWKPFENMHAQILVNALCKVDRVDLLVKMKAMIEANCHLQKHHDFDGINEASTVSLPDLDRIISEPFEPLDAKNMVLVLHYEKTKTEKENFKWFWRNFKEHLKQPVAKGLTPLDVTKLVKNDGGNVLQILEQVYNQFPHIIVCFNEAYSTALTKNDPEEKFSLRKLIHDKTVVEFLQNGNRNKRCRCLLMPGHTKVDTMWATVTYQYSWPDTYEQLLERVLGMKINLKDLSSQQAAENEKMNNKHYNVTK